MLPHKSSWLAAIVALAGFVLLYWRVFQKLVYDWGHDDNYSHGFFIIPLAAYFAWERLPRIRQTAADPSLLGVPVIVISLAMLVAGTLGAELFLTRLSIVGTLVGTILFVGGWRPLRTMVFPIAFLLLMIPLPAIVFNQIAFPLQLLASRFGAWSLQIFGIPVLREGNIIVLANTTLEVAEACSGIRSLVTLLTLGVVLGYFRDSRQWTRTAVALSTVPVAIASNGIRVAGTGIAAAYVGPAAATGFLHTFSGWLMFVLAFLLLIAVQSALLRFFPTPATTKPSTAGAVS